MIKIKGAPVSDAIKAIKRRHGDQAYNTIVGLLEEETRALFEQAPILPTSWYSLDAFVQFLEMDLKVTAEGNEQELIQRSEDLIERQLRGIYKLFIKLGSPEFVLKRIAVIHRTYFQGVSVEVRLSGAGKAVVKYTGFEKQHRLIGLSIIGFYQKALELSGAKAVKAEYTTSIEDDKGYCELMLSWNDK